MTFDVPRPAAAALRSLTRRMDAYWIGQGLDPDDLATVSWRPVGYVAFILMPMIGLVPAFGILTAAFGPMPALL